MKKYLIALTAVLLLSLAYIKYQPVVTYLSGKLEAKLSRGKISGHSVYKLPVPFHRQEHSLSCEIAALKMALAGVGVDVPESELISHLPFDPTPRQSGVWGDPYKAFVGDIDGKMFSTGYGVYWQPIADVGLKYKRTEVLENGTIEQLIDHLNQGHPIVVWGYYGRGNRSTWTTPEGRRIEGVNGEHARTLIGYTGDSSNPES
ncbi:MAG TPA: C39 family peptidase, partial [Verrucomicrobiae bacterium]|nr:C39 family peptidase [Verrucomicrobiae bacterium]